MLFTAAELYRGVHVLTSSAVGVNGVEPPVLLLDLLKRLLLATDGTPSPLIIAGVKELYALDMACGPGTWVLAQARTRRRWCVTGVDQGQQMIAYAERQYQSQQGEDRPGAFRLVQDFARSPFDDESFDLVHTEFPAARMSEQWFAEVRAECYRVLRSGGMFWFTECLGFRSPSLALKQLLNIYHQSIYSTGLLPLDTERFIGGVLGALYRELGCDWRSVQQEYTIFDCSAGTAVHAIFCEMLALYMHTLRPWFESIRDIIPISEYDAICHRVRQEMRSKEFQCKWHIQNIWCIKT